MNATMSISMTITKELSQIEYEDMVRQLSNYDLLKSHIQNQMPGSKVNDLCVVVEIGR